MNWQNFAVGIIDFGSQYTQLLARRMRELGLSSVIIPYEDALAQIEKKQLPKAIILSGGPHSVFLDNRNFKSLFALKNIPMLGVCYGMQLMAHHNGGKVEKGEVGEYGHTELFSQDNFYAEKLQGDVSVWMSHFDQVKSVGNDFKVILKSPKNVIAGFQHNTLPWLAYQFHAEVDHGTHNREFLEYFCFEVAKLKPDWDIDSMLEDIKARINFDPKKKVLCAFSGGVDSLVAAVIAQKVLGADPYCFYVDTGLQRIQDAEHIKTLQTNLGLKIEVVDASQLFLDRLANVAEPEQKRKIIGHTFIEVFEQKVHQFESEKGIKFDYLLQGTLYPDVIESVSPHGKDGPSVTIKSHHNVGGLPERMHLELLEPLRFLFKDEVRRIGLSLDLPRQWLFRHPFPGPALGVRIMGDVSVERLRMVREADHILYQEMLEHNLYDSIWQAFTVFLPVKTVGVKGDERAYEEVICVRLVNSFDGMTAKISQVPFPFLEKVSSRIANEVKGITRVVYDITSKPPGTIEWE